MSGLVRSVGIRLLSMDGVVKVQMRSLEAMKEKKYLQEWKVKIVKRSEHR